MFAGISPAMSLQKRQSATLPPQHRHAWDSLQVPTNAFDRPARLTRRIAYGRLLPEAEFNNEPAPGRKTRRGFVQKTPDHEESIKSRVQRRRRFVLGDFRLQRRFVRVWHVGGIGNNQIGVL